MFCSSKSFVAISKPVGSVRLGLPRCCDADMAKFTMAFSVAQSNRDNSDVQLAKLFEQAKEEFERESHQPINVLRHFDTVDDFVEQVRKEKAAFGSFREHEHPNLFRHIRNALKPVQILADIFSGPASNVSGLDFPTI